MQVQIPNDTDTTYWCATTELPQEVQRSRKYVIRVSSSKLVLSVTYSNFKYNCNSVSNGTYIAYI